MISDVLSEAAAEIRSHLVRQPSVYAPYAGVINEALTAMERARVLLDQLPDPTGPQASAREVAWMDATASVPKIF